MRSRGWIAAIAAAVFALDRILKILVATHMQVGESIPVLPPILWITYITNSGAAFSLLRHATWLFIAIAVLILLGLGWYVARASELTRRFGVGAGLLAGGTAGNLWDRVVNGRVIDYIHFRYWAIFNVADVAIVVGIILIVWDFWLKDREHGEISRRRHG
ncbi:MAG: signal peptidase II [Firmicutes bacterium]|nr:signal peptidase II [Bacillota bacterium]